MILHAALFALLSLSTDGSSTVLTLSAEEVRRAGITLSTVTERPSYRQARVVGEVVRSPGATHPVRTLVEARVEELAVAPGDRVVVGQTLMILHAHQLHVLQSRLLAALHNLRLAETHLDGGRRLLEIEGIARIEVERRQQQVLQARLEVQEARIELHELDLTDDEIDALADVDPQRDEMHPLLPLRSPVSGVVLETPVAEATWVQAFEELLVIGDPERLELALQVTPDVAATVQRGDTIDFRPVGQASGTCTARVVTRVPQVDPTTRTMILRAKILERTAHVLPGVFVEGTVRGSGPGEMRPLIEQSAVVRVGGEDHVFVSLGEGRYELRPVRLGTGNGAVYEVVGGLHEGEQIVTSGALLLKSKLVRGSEGLE